jgi:hypothetical protein
MLLLEFIHINTTGLVKAKMCGGNYALPFQQANPKSGGSAISANPTIFETVL